MLTITWTNGQVTLIKDLIFGVSVLGEEGWVPLSELNDDDKALVTRLVDHNPSCPFLEHLS